METISVCPYCGCGCKLKYVVEDGKLVRVLPYEKDDVSEGKPCIKGLTVNEVVDKGRIKKPMIRKNGKLVETTWEEALNHIYENTKKLKPDEVLFTTSGKIPNEDNYVIQKFARSCFNAINIDSCCTRLCHASTLLAMKEFFGASNLTVMDNINKVDCLLVTGSDPASNYPVFFNKIMKNKEKIKIISVQPRINHTSRFGNMFIRIDPGSEFVFLSAVINALLQSGYDKDVENYQGFSEMKQAASEFTPDLVSEVCKVDKKDFEKVVETIKNSRTFAVFHGMGITQHMNAMKTLRSLFSLMLLKKGLILSLRGENNVQGVGDVTSADNLKNVRKEKGKNLVEGILLSPVKAAFITGFNPAQSMPDLEKVHKNLENMFLVCMEPYPSLTTELADVVLPTPTIMERNGTVTNGERRIRLVSKALGLYGRPEWQIFNDLSKLFGKSFGYESEKQIFQEITENVIPYKDVDPDSVYSGNDAWADKKIKFQSFHLEKYEKPKEPRCKDYPFLLTTFRSKFQFLTGEMSSRSKTLSKMYDPHIHINANDAKELNINEGDKVKVSSRLSSIEGKAKICPDTSEKVVACDFHSEKLLVNKLFPPDYDKESFTPNYRAVAVKLEKVSE